MSNYSQTYDANHYLVENNDQVELAELLEQHQYALEGFIKRNLGMRLKQKVEAHDILQNTMISAIKSFDSQDFTQLDSYAWLCHLVEQRIIDAHRHFFGTQKRSANKEVGLETPLTGSRQLCMIDVLAASMTTPTQAIQRDENIDAMETAFNTLSDEQKQALHLRFVEGLSLQEISERLGKSNGATRVMLSRAIAKVQSVIYEEQG